MDVEEIAVVGEKIAGAMDLQLSDGGLVIESDGSSVDQK
jgi:hypothetical protein